MGGPGGVVVGIAVDRPERIDQSFERLRQVVVGGDGVGPNGVAAHGGNLHRPQHRTQHWRINKGDVSMPVVGIAVVFAIVQIQHLGALFQRRQGGMGSGDGAKSAGKGDLPF